MSTIKEKILSYCNQKGIKKSKIAQKIEVSETNFTGRNLQSSIGSDALVKFLTAFPEVSAEWLLRDEGPMFRNGDTNMVNGVNNGHVGSTYGVEKQETPAPSCDQCALLAAKDQVIEAQRIAIDALRH